MEHFYLLKQYDSLMDLINSRCKLNLTSLNYETYYNLTKSNHIIIFPYFEEFSDKDQDILVDGEYCIITRDLNIKGGVLRINKNISFEKKNSDIYFKRKLFHVMTHILIFEPTLLKGLKLVKNNAIISDGVKQTAKVHFNCFSFIVDKNFGIPLDEDGTHWDPRYMLSDYMMPIEYYEILILERINHAPFFKKIVYKIIKLILKSFVLLQMNTNAPHLEQAKESAMQ